MFLRRRGIQPDAMKDMHLYDILLEIMEAIDPAHDADQSTSPQQTGGSDGRFVVNPKPGQSTAQAMKAMREAGEL
jgi:hypothetical protein